MTSKIFSVATFILVAWLTVTVVTTSGQLSVVEHSMSGKIDASYELLRNRISALEDDQQNSSKQVIALLEKQNKEKPKVVTESNNAQVEQLQSQARVLQEKTENQQQEIVRFREENQKIVAESKALQQQLHELNQFKDLRTAYQQVLETEFEKNDDATLAAEKLLSTKKAIWKASTLHQNVKAELQGLMGPIDVLASQWKSGNIRGSVSPVYNVLNQSLATLDTP